MNLRTLFAASLVAMSGACAAVPDKLPVPELRDNVPLAGVPAAADAAWPEPEWWRRYDDAELDRLIEIAAGGSTSLAEARARVEQAVSAARVRAAEAGLRIGGNVQVARHRMSENGLIPTELVGFTWYTQGDLGVQLNYDVDWWGKHRAAVEAAIGQARSAEAEQAAAALVLEATVAETWFGWLADQARLELAADQIKATEQMLHIATLRVHAGLEPADSTEQPRAELAAARQREAALLASAGIRRAALAALLGVAPDELPDLEPRSLPEAGAGLPAGASLDLIARRPDIAASRWQVYAALRGTDIARAQFYPDLEISALAGLSSVDLGKLLDAGSRTFAVSPALHLPIFEGGLLKANYGLSKARLNGAIAQYNATVVAAAREVATEALTIEQLAAQRTGQQIRVRATAALRDSAEARRRQGVTDARPALAATAEWLQERDRAILLNAQSLIADVSLIRALGGGYRTVDPEEATLSSARNPSP